MAQQIIDVGNVANDGTGDPLRTAFQMVNDNFTDVYHLSNISNGSSRIDIARDAEIYMTSNGVANVMVVSTDNISMGVPALGNAMTVTIYGDLNVTGNAVLTGNILGDRVQNGNTILDIQSPGGNANLAVNGVTNVVVFADTGEYIDGLLSVTGNITGNNLSIGNDSNIGGNLIVTINTTSGNFYTAGEISATGNITGGNIATGGEMTIAGNLSANNVNAVNSVASNVVVAAIDVVGGNLYTGGVVSATGNITAGNIDTAGNVTGGNLLTGGIVSVAANIFAHDIAIGTGSTGNAIIYGNLTVYGNTTTIESNTVTTNDLNITVGNNQNTGAALNNAGIDVGNNNLATWRFNDATTSWQSNINVTPTSNAVLNLGGPANWWNTLYAANLTVSNIAASGNINAGNLRTTGSISATGNITVGNIIATNIGNVAAANFDGNGSNILLGNGSFGNTSYTMGALNYVQNSVSGSQTVYTTDTFPYTIVSATISTGGNPVQVIVTGDANPLTAGAYGRLQLYRDSSAIGQIVQYESSAANENVPYALTVIDTPVYGSHTYALKVVSLTGNTQFGEAAGPVLDAIEIQNVRGLTGAPFAFRTVSANGVDIIANISEATITYTPGNNLVLTGNATSNVVTFAVADAPSFVGNVTGANLLTGGLISATGNITGSNVNATTASVTGNATIGNANIGAYTTNALRVNGTGYIVNSAVADPYPNTGTFDVAAVTQPNVVIRGYSQTTSNTSGPVLQFVRKQQTGTALSSGLDAGRMKFWAIQPNNDTYNYIGELAGITAGAGTDGQLEFYTGLANVPQLVLTLNSSKQANFTGEVSAGGNVTAPYFIGNIIGNVSGNLSVPGLSTQVLFNDSGVANATSGFTFNKTSNAVTISGNVSTGNVSGTNLTGTTVSVTGTVTAASTVGGVITGSSVSVTGTATAASTVGGVITGSSASVTGTVTAASTVGGVITGSSASVTGTVTAASTVGGVITGSSVSVSGNVISANVLTGGVRNNLGSLTVSTGSGALNLSPASNIVVNSTYINSVADPVQNQDVATKKYVDNLVSTGINYHDPVYAATTTTLAATTGGTITYAQPNGAANGVGATITTTGSFDLIDTANVQTLNTRILVKNEANAVLNGVYTWSNATTIVRSTDTDEYGTDSTQAISLNDYFFVQSGNVNAGSAYVVSSPTGTITFGTSNITFAQFSSSQTYTANTAAGISINGTVINARVDNLTTAFSSGNIVVKTGAQLTTPNIGAATGTSLSVTGTVTAASTVGGVITGSSTSVSGTVTAASTVGGVISGSSVSVTGTVTAASTVGGVITGSSTSVTGTVTAASTVGGVITGSSTSVTGTVTAASTVGGVITGSSLSVSGSVTGGAYNGTSVSVSGTVTAASTVGGVITGSSVSVNGNITGGNLSVGSGAITLNNIIHSGTPGAGNIGSASDYFNYVFATATTALYADLAEKYLSDAKYEPGTVVSLGGAAEVTKSTEDGDRRIAGIVSSNPAFIMNSGLTHPNSVTVALQGRVPCLVQGTVRRGDMMVSAGNGRARAEPNPNIGSVLGKALEDFNGDQGVIEVIVGRI